MVDIAYAVPGGGMSDAELTRRENIANGLVDAEVTILENEGGPDAIENTVEEQWSIPGLLRLIEANEAAFDAFVIGCFGDPGLAAARELVETPVVGPAAASFHTATQLADRFTCLTILDSTVRLTRELIHDYRFEDQCASVRVVEAPVLEIDHDSDELVDRMIERGREAVEEDGAEALVPGCMSLSFMQEHDHIAAEVGVPFIDPVTVGLETASLWARHGLSHSQVTYARADREKLGRLLTDPAPQAPRQ